jgi:crotonobetainyl-CoA:carnitine CoA-transferase CaiB-like acyl-CoA transferase
VIEIVKVGDSDPIPYKPNPTQPLSGIKVLSLTHVIAGTTAARTLAENGADVLHIARDQSFEHELLVTEVNVGMRSAFVDLKNPAQNRAFSTLVPDADVFIEGFRGRAMERLGFGVKEVAAKRPGIIYLSVALLQLGWPMARASRLRHGSTHRLRVHDQRGRRRAKQTEFPSDHGA